MQGWKVSYLRKLGGGLFVSVLMKIMNMVSNTFEGVSILLLVTILLHEAGPRSQD